MSRNFMSYVFLYPLLRKNQHHLQLIYDSFENKENMFHFQLHLPYFYLKMNSMIQHQYYLYSHLPLSFYKNSFNFLLKNEYKEKNENMDLEYYIYSI